ncbi:MAG: ergothioneine biosynthesis protein EgtB [Chitinophagaceae bacterium]|nr:ergothioneine biosynthesis protein EgtB [Oligoflexus sp.]
MESSDRSEANPWNLKQRLEQCRKRSLTLCSGLEIEDMTIQPTVDVSPLKWHLAHPTWFFEELILLPHCLTYKRFDDGYRRLFNSYYKSLGTHWAQGHRGSLSRPTVRDIGAYRTYVDEHLLSLCERNADPALGFLLELGIQHEQQHQELILMDLKYILSLNPCRPVYAASDLPYPTKHQASWIEFQEGLYEIGAASEGFSFDNERSRHKSYLYPFAIADSLVTNGEYLQFLTNGGYSQPEYWLSQGWDWVQAERIDKPLYWSQMDGKWFEYSLHGLIPLEPDFPLVHISYFEADAFSRWRSKRLPSEQEMEVYLRQTSERSNDLYFHPTDAGAPKREVWCWTKSQYSAYPRFKEFSGPLQEYNGKFMCNQFVLRGGCFGMPEGHYRDTYRNFYLAHQRWMFSGIRLAKDLL